MKFELGLLCSFSTFSLAYASPRVDTTGKNGFFYRGTEFTKIFTEQSGTPFLDPGIPTAGWVNYYGSRYDGVMLQYDIEDDQLVSHDITGAIRMQLVKEKISSFGLIPGIIHYKSYKADLAGYKLPSQDIVYAIQGNAIPVEPVFCTV